MKSRNRDINIFSLSVVDLFASALGAFVLLFLILIPYYLKTDRVLLAQASAATERADQCEAEVESVSGALSLCEQNLEEALNRAERAEQSTLEKNPFLLVTMTWSSPNGAGDDVDLHVIDPSGREYYYGQKRHPGSPAELEIDSLRGPASEVWLHPEVSSGEYRVVFNYYRSSSAPVVVKGKIVHQQGRVVLPDMRLSRVGERRQAAVVVVAADGTVSIR